MWLTLVYITLCTLLVCVHSNTYPGTATERNVKVTEAAAALGVNSKQLSGDWESVRKNVLAACGLSDNRSSRPGSGYTGHCFNDFNHVDCCTMTSNNHHNENKNQVKGIHHSNQLGPGITQASLALGLSEEEKGGSWCTCQLGAGRGKVPVDVCHTQFKSRIGFKMVWCPGANQKYETIVLVNDDGDLLASGQPSSVTVPLRERRNSYYEVAGSKYANGCEASEGHSELR